MNWFSRNGDRLLMFASGVIRVSDESDFFSFLYLFPVLLLREDLRQGSQDAKVYAQ